MKRLAVTVAVAVLVVPLSPATTVLATETTASTADRTSIDSCRVIKSPGTYVLTSNITNSSEQYCLQVEADNVTIDGDGHTIDATVTGADGPGDHGVSAFDVENLTVRDVVLTDWVTGIYHLDGADATYRNVTAARNSVGMGVIDADGSRIVDSEARENRNDGDSEGAGIVVTDSRNVTVRNNTVVDNRDGIRTYGSADGITVVDNRVVESGSAPDAGDGIVFRAPVDGARVADNTVSGTDILVRGTDLAATENEMTDGDLRAEGGAGTIVANEVTNGTISQSGDAAAEGRSVVRDNTVTRSEEGIRVAAARVLVAGNTVTDAGSGIHLLGTGENRTVRENQVTDSTTGLHITHYDGGVVRDNDLSGNENGIRIEYTGPREECDNRTVLGAIHGNDLGDNTYGVRNEGERTVDATNNDWGAGGPSSRTARPLEDPVTGALADGDGAAVSEGSTDGVSNVHFDGTTANATS